MLISMCRKLVYPTRCWIPTLKHTFFDIKLGQSLAMNCIVPLILLLHIITASDDHWDTDDLREILGLTEQAKAYYNDPNPFVNCSSCKHK